jgi:hypothetical protein
MTSSTGSPPIWHAWPPPPSFEPVQVAMRAGRTKLGLQDYRRRPCRVPGDRQDAARTTHKDLKTKYDRWIDLEGTVSKVNMPELLKLNDCVDPRPSAHRRSRWISAFAIAQQQVLTTRDWDAGSKVATDLQADLLTLSKQWAVWAKKNPDDAKRKFQGADAGDGRSGQGGTWRPCRSTGSSMSWFANVAASLTLLGQEDGSQASALQGELDALKAARQEGGRCLVDPGPAEAPDQSGAPRSTRWPRRPRALHPR